MSCRRSCGAGNPAGEDSRGDGALGGRGRSAGRRERAWPNAAGAAQAADWRAPDSKQMNVTDPESRRMKTARGGFEQGYNAQVAIDAARQLIVAADLTATAADAGQLVPLEAQAETTTGVRATTVLADCGDKSEANFAALERRGSPRAYPSGRARSRGGPRSSAGDPARSGWGRSCGPRKAASGSRVPRGQPAADGDADGCAGSAMNPRPPTRRASRPSRSGYARSSACRAVPIPFPAAAPRVSVGCTDPEGLLASRPRANRGADS
jgi:hypothetical protein